MDNELRRRAAVWRNLEYNLDLFAYEVKTKDAEKLVRRKTLIEKSYAYIRKKCEEYSSEKLIGSHSIIESAKRYVS